MSEKFIHPALGLIEVKPLIYTAMSKHYFYFRMFISKFVFEQGGAPINPFMAADYFLLDTVERDIIRQANNTYLQKSDEIWCFGPVSDGVLAEVKIAQANNKPIRYFEIVKSKDIVEVTKTQVMMELDVERFRAEL